MIISLFELVIYILFKHSINENISTIIGDKMNNSKIIHYENLFNSIEYDFYNLSLIYNDSYNTIKIKHKSKKNLLEKEICIFGVLVNDLGLQIEHSMLEWLLPEYDVYCVYQKYPGELYEYPALRFAQWFSITYDVKIVLYVHTKGAFTPFPSQEEVIELWKNEFTSPRKYLYINLIKENFFEICLPFRKRTVTFFNGMFISIRAFKLIDNIIFNTNRFYYEEKLFKDKDNKIRIRGILNDSTTHEKVRDQNTFFLKYFKNLKKINNKRVKTTPKILLLMIFLISIFILKKLNYLK